MGRGLLLLVSGFLIIFGMVQNSVQNRQQVLAERSPEYFYEEQSRNIAASVMEIALAKYNDNFYWSGNYTNNSIMGGIGKVRVDSTAAFGSRVYLSIEGIIETPEVRTTTTIKATANRPAFSIYSYFTSEEPSYIAFGSSDTLNGPVHTNGTFHMRGDPVFNGRVTSPNDWQDVSSDGDSEPEFKKGANFESNEIPLDPSITESIPQNAENGGLKFNDDKIKVEFKEDGTVDITQYQKTGTETRCVKNCSYHPYYREYEDFPIYGEGISNPQYTPYNMQDSTNFNGIISSAGNIEVRGKLKGNVTLHSEQNIEIIGDIVYEDFDPSNPTAKLNSNNLLGIVSEGDISVDENAHTDGYNTSQNLNITASVMAMGKSFEVEKYGSGNHRGQLRILGGLIQQERGAVGTAGGTGYDKLYSYDERLLENSTPDFPKVKRFRIESWRETTEQGPIN